MLAAAALATAAPAGASLLGGLVAAAHKPRLPAVRTGAARGVTHASATLLGRVRPAGRTVYFFQYGVGRRYSSRTAARRLHGRRSVDVAFAVRRLRSATAYRYRLVATTCNGCRGGTRYGAARTFRTWPPPPAVSTGPARSVTSSSAGLGGTLNAHGRRVTFSFQYGTSRRYGSSTAVKGGGAARARRRVSAAVASLRPSTTYHFRLVVTSCRGCAAGTAYGRDHQFSTHAQVVPAQLTPQQGDALRAVATYQAMQQFFYAPNVYPGDTTSLYAPDYPHGSERYSHLWAFSRALAGTLTLSGIPPSALAGASYASDVDDRLTGLATYWDGGSTGPGYDSSPVPPVGPGGDKFYDDQAWIGSALVSHFELTGAPTSLTGAENAFNFVYPGGWDAVSSDFDPGGVFWVQQGVGRGETNHDRATAANLPNADVAFRLEQLDPANAHSYDSAAMAMYRWVDHYLYNVPVNPTDPAAPNPNYDPSEPALVWGPLRGSQIVKSHWTYNQGGMVADDVLAYRHTGNPTYLAQAETLARTALDTFSERDYLAQPVAFDAIYFRGLLQLYQVTADPTLRTRILQTLQTFADDAWSNYRTADGLFRLPSSSGYRLIDQGALVQVFAMLAWDPGDYAKLP
jgi:hypothetical protein